MESRGDGSGLADRKIVEQLRAGDEAAFDTIYNAYAPGLIRFANSYLNSIPAAEDAVADVFVNLWELRRDWNPRYGIAAYLYTALRNRALNMLRNSRTAQRLEELSSFDDEPIGMGAPEQSISDTIDTDEQIKQLRALIRTFKPERQRLVMLRWQQGLSVQQIADILQISHNAVEQQLSRALRAIKAVAPGVLK